MATYIYARVSTSQQETENQLSALRKHAPAALVFQDQISGSKRKPALLRLMSIWREGDTVYVYKLDRLSRDTLELLQVLRLAERKGVKIVPLTQSISDDPSGKLLSVILAGVSEFERNLISERTKNALAQIKESGRELGGFRRSCAVPFTETEESFIEARIGEMSWAEIQRQFQKEFTKTYANRDYIRVKYLRFKKYKSKL